VRRLSLFSALKLLIDLISGVLLKTSWIASRWRDAKSIPPYDIWKVQKSIGFTEHKSHKVFCFFFSKKKASFFYL